MADKICPVCKGTGRVYDPQTHKMVLCPECAKRRQEEIRTGNVNGHTFGLGADDLTDTFIYSKAVLYASSNYTTKSTGLQEKYITQLLKDLEKHNKPQESVCFGLGKYGRPDLLAYAIASVAYIAGMSVAPVLTTRQIYDLALYEKQELGRIVANDIMIIVIPVNPTRASFRHSVGLMTERAMKGKATIFITTYEKDKCEEALAKDNARKTMMLAKPLFVEPRVKKNQSEAVFKDNLGLIEEET